MTNKEKYCQFYLNEKDIPIFCKDWWLDNVCGEDNWDVALVEKGGDVFASLPYFKTKKAFFNIITMPKLTQTMGPYIKYPNGQKYYKKLSWEKEVMTSLINQLPNVDYFSQNFSHKITNWLPFYWAGYEQTTRYTYIIENIDITALERNFETDARRRRVKKARKIGVKVVESDDIELFYELNKKTFIRKMIQIPYTFNYIKNIYTICNKKSACKMLFAYANKDVIAANLLIYDDRNVYYLTGGIEPDKTDIGGMDLIMLESIRFALNTGRRFDFEGSMVESLEKYFRSFGAMQVPYFNIIKRNSMLLKAALLFR